MKPRLAALGIAAGVLFASVCVAADKPKSNTSDDMQRAIAWEHYKDMAAARQARLEARHPSVTTSDRSANREMDESTQGRKVKDPGPRKEKKDQ